MSAREHEIRVPRSARFYTLGEPATARDVWLVCHGYGQLAGRFIQLFEQVASPERCIIAPEGLSRFYTDVAMREKVGASWMTKEHRQAEISDYVAYLDAVMDHVLGGGRQDVRVTALGFSQGASTASRWAVFGRHRVDRLILWGGELPTDLDLAAAAPRFANLEVVMVRGKGDDYITPKVVAAMLARLQEHGAKHRLVEFEGGHEIDRGVLMDLA